MDLSYTKLFEEIREHTIDCDYNRAQHHLEYQTTSRKANICRGIQIACLLSLIIYYMVIPELSDTWTDNILIKFTPLFFSIVATITQIIEYCGNFTELSQRHWIAAQAYTRIYRECQFFHIHYAKVGIDVMRAKAQDIASELSDLNNVSPTLNEKTYKKITPCLKDKHYPIDDIISKGAIITETLQLSENKNNIILPQSSADKAIQKLVNDVSKIDITLPIEIYLFGSYLYNEFYNDIDIAIIIHEKNENQIAILKKKIENIRLVQFYKGIIFDITILTENQLNKDQINEDNFLFYKNIKKGKLLYTSDSIPSGKALNNRNFDFYYSTVIQKYFGLVQKQETIDLNAIYKYFYYLFIYILEQNHIDFRGDTSMSNQLLILINKVDDEVLKDAINLYFKLKNNIYLSNKELCDCEKSEIHSILETTSIIYNINNM